MGHGGNILLLHNMTKTISKLVTHGANRTHASSFLNR